MWSYEHPCNATDMTSPAHDWQQCRGFRPCKAAAEVSSHLFEEGLGLGLRLPGEPPDLPVMDALPNLQEEQRQSGSLHPSRRHCLQSHN